MSNVILDIARRAVDAFARRDMSSFAECFDEEVVWVPLPDVPDITEPAHGRRGVLAMLDRWLAPWDHYESPTRELLELDDDVVLWTTHVMASDDARGMRLDQDIFAVLDFRGDKIVLARWFWDRDEALAAAGAHDTEEQLAALRNGV
jgi:ketosteroid isomerase-like protein